MRKILLLTTLLLSALPFATLAADTAATPKVATLGQPAPNFTATDATGKTISLADYKGKIVVLEWVNIDCPIDGRVVDSKLISTVHNKFKDKVVWLAIDSAAAHTKADYEKTIATWKLPYALLNDVKGTIGHLYDAKTTPHMFIINTDGKLVYQGAIDNDPDGSKTTKLNYVDQALTELLTGKPVSIAESKPYGCSVKY